jgi:predicted amidohydrolase YtcJ
VNGKIITLDQKFSVVNTITIEKDRIIAVGSNKEIRKLADLAVLSDDLLTYPVDEIKGIRSELTIVGGKVVYGQW